MRHAATSSWLVFRVFILSSFWLLALFDSLGVVRFVHFSMLWLTLSYFVVFNLFRLVFFWNDTNNASILWRLLLILQTWWHLGPSGGVIGMEPALEYARSFGAWNTSWITWQRSKTLGWNFLFLTETCLRHLKSTQFDGNFIDFFVWRHRVYCI